MLEAKVSESVSMGDGGIDFEKVCYTSESRGTVYEGYFLSGYDKETEYGAYDIHVTYSVKGRERKVEAAKRIVTKNDKDDPLKKYSFYNKFEDDILSDEMEASKKASPDGRATVNLRSVEIFVPFFCTRALINKAIRDENGKATKKVETVEYTPNKAILLGLGVGDLFFASAKSGMGKMLNKAFEKNYLKNNKIKVSYADIDDMEPLKDEEKDIQKEVKNLRMDKKLLQNMFGHLLPISYKEWYEETQGKRYYTNREIEMAKKEGITLNYELDALPEAETELAPF